MITQDIFLDVAPDPAGNGALLAVTLLVIGFIALLAVGLFLFLWYRKRNMRHAEMICPDIDQPSPLKRAN